MLDNLRKRVDLGKVLIVFTILFTLVAAIALVSTFVIGSAAHTSNMERLKSDIAAMNEQVEAYAAEKEASVDANKETVVSPKDKGATIAEYQTEYMDVFLDKDFDENRVAEMAGEMSKYFDEKDALAASPWITKSDVDYDWTFESGYTVSFDGAAKLVPCAWECYAKTGNARGDLMAYAFADYDGEADVFKNVRIYRTKYGTEHVTVLQIGGE